MVMRKEEFDLVLYILDSDFWLLILSPCSMPYVFSNPQSETGNPPEGWESEGQIRNPKLPKCLVVLLPACPACPERSRGERSLGAVNCLLPAYF